MNLTAEQEERLAALLSDLTTRRERGESADVEDVARVHPELADELRALWATAQFASAFARPANLDGQATRPATEEATAPPALFGDYEIIEELGRGGMGVVYKARQKSLNRMVAIKMMRDAKLASETDRARFRAEAAAAAKLKHPNIITVHEVGEHDGQPFFVMEYVDGIPLNRLAALGPLPPREAASLLAAIARAVQHAHEHGILHRDLKPSNILLARSGEPGIGYRVSGIEESTGIKEGDNRTGVLDFRYPIPDTRYPKVSDFGLAKRFVVGESLTEARTQTGAIVGTPSYMAPEQATGRRDLTPAADVWSLGAILYELLTGRPPFQAANPVDTLLMVIEQEPVPPRWLDPGIDRDLEMICLKCLQKPLDLRYASAGELARDLEAFVAGDSLASPPSGLRYFLSRMLRETHHIEVLQNWGLLWIWHSLAIIVLCLLTQAMDWSGVRHHLAYLVLWSVGLVAWGTILWQLRRRAGPVLFVERLIAHAWAAGVCASIGMFVIEVLIGLPVLTLSPAIAVAAGMVFVFKAGILSGRFYITAAAMFVTAAIMPLLPDVNILLFGLVSALCFFVPGVKYYRQRLAAMRE